MKNIVILGSCATRDVFRVLNPLDLSLVEYTARTSFASQFSQKVVSNRIKACQLERLDSGFQRKMVLRDFDKGFFSSIETIDFDYIVIDFIDERARLLVLDGGILNFSNELNRSKYLSSLTNKGYFIESASDEHFSKWKDGWEVFVSECQSRQILDKVVINKIYWASCDDFGRNISEYSMFDSELIDKSNNYLDNIYEFCAHSIKEDRFLVYDDSDFIADSNHAWGVAPFHYTHDLYNLTYKKILNLQ